MAQENSSSQKVDENEDLNKEGDKNSPQPSSGRTDQGSTTQSVKKEASQPGGSENVAGAKETDIEPHQSNIGSKPIPTDLIDKGD